MLWVDAFTDVPMGGNPCAVVFDAADIPETRRIAFTRETGLVECAFMVPSEVADFGVRYYMATGEIRMAGHPTIATAVALEAEGLLSGRDAFTLEVGAGVLPVDISRPAGREPVFTMTQMAPVFGRRYGPDEIAPMVGLGTDDIAAPPQTVAVGGTAFCITLLRDEGALRRARLDPAAALPDADFMEPFLCITEGATRAGDTFARLLLAPPLPPEDPFTGSATGCMAAWLWTGGHIAVPRLVAEQGHWMDRPGRAEVEVLGSRDAITGVRVGGSGAVLIDGRVTL